MSPASPGRAVILTGVNLISLELVAKRLELLRELVPATVRVAVLFNPANAEFAETTLRDVELAARALGLQIPVLSASSSREIDAAFATFAHARPDSLFVGNDPFSPPGAFSWQPRRRTTRSPRRLEHVKVSKPVG